MKKLTFFGAVLIVAFTLLPINNLSAKNNSSVYYFADINRFYQDFGKIFWENGRGNELSITRDNDFKKNSKFVFDEDGKMIKRISSAARQSFSQDQMNYFYDGDQLETVVEENSDFNRVIKFDYTQWGRLYSFTEEIHFTNNNQKNIYSKFDIYKYKLDAKGNVYEVRGANKKFFGLFTSNYKIVKLYDYNADNRLKATHDFILPESNALLINSKDYVLK